MFSYECHMDPGLRSPNLSCNSRKKVNTNKPIYTLPPRSLANHSHHRHLPPEYLHHPRFTLSPRRCSHQTAHPPPYRDLTNQHTRASYISGSHTREGTAAITASPPPLLHPDPYEGLRHSHNAHCRALTIGNKLRASATMGF